MSESLDPLKRTTRPLHRFWISVPTEQHWYALINECRSLYGRNWRTKKGVRRKFNPCVRRGQLTHARIRRLMILFERQLVWFEVPDENWASWIAVKYSIEVASDPARFNGK